MGGPIILLPSRPLVYNMGMVRVLVEMHRNLILLHPVIMLPLIAFLQDQRYALVLSCHYRVQCNAFCIIRVSLARFLPRVCTTSHSLAVERSAGVTMQIQPLDSSRYIAWYLGMAVLFSYHLSTVRNASKSHPHSRDRYCFTNIFSGAVGETARPRPSRSG